MSLRHRLCRSDQSGLRTTLLALVGRGADAGGRGMGALGDPRALARSATTTTSPAHASKTSPSRPQTGSLPRRDHQRRRRLDGPGRRPLTASVSAASAGLTGKARSARTYLPSSKALGRGDARRARRFRNRELPRVVHVGRHRSGPGLGLRRRQPRVRLGDGRRTASRAVVGVPGDPARARRSVRRSSSGGRSGRSNPSGAKSLTISADDLDRGCRCPPTTTRYGDSPVTMNTMLERLSGRIPATRVRCRRLARAAEPDHRLSGATRSRPGPPDSIDLEELTSAYCSPTSTAWNSWSAICSTSPGTTSDPPNPQHVAARPRRDHRRGGRPNIRPRRRRAGRQRVSAVRCEAMPASWPGCSAISSTTQQRHAEPPGLGQRRAWWTTGWRPSWKTTDRASHRTSAS